MIFLQFDERRGLHQQIKHVRQVHVEQAIELRRDAAGCRQMIQEGKGLKEPFREAAQMPADASKKTANQRAGARY